MNKFCRYLILSLILMLSVPVLVRARTLVSTDSIYVPILYATDRPLNNESTSGIDYGNDQMPDAGATDPERSLNYGIKTVKIRLPIYCSLTDTQASSFGCLAAGPNDAVPGPTIVENVTLKRAEFLDRAKQIQKKFATTNLILFVHGCCSPYEGAVERAAAASLWYRCPVIMYDWDSPKWDYANTKLFWTKGDYHKNEDHCTAAERRFIELTDELEQLVDTQNLSILAHSMGNRLLDAYLAQRNNRYENNANHKRLRSIEFANADVSAQRAVSYCHAYSSAAEKCRIYLDDKDQALELSRQIHGANRLGAPHNDLNFLVNQIEKESNIDMIDHSLISGNSHDLPFWLVSDLYRGPELSANRKCHLTLVKPHLFRVEP